MSMSVSWDQQQQIQKNKRAALERRARGFVWAADDVMSLITAFLPPLQTQPAFRLVCKRFKQFCPATMPGHAHDPGLDIVIRGNFAMLQLSAPRFLALLDLVKKLPRDLRKYNEQTKRWLVPWRSLNLLLLPADMPSAKRLLIAIDNALTRETELAREDARLNVLIQRLQQRQIARRQLLSGLAEAASSNDAVTSHDRPEVMLRLVSERLNEAVVCGVEASLICQARTVEERLHAEIQTQKEARKKQEAREDLIRALDAVTPAGGSVTDNELADELRALQAARTKALALGISSEDLAEVLADARQTEAELQRRLALKQLATAIQVAAECRGSTEFVLLKSAVKKLREAIHSEQLVHVDGDDEARGIWCPLDEGSLPSYSQVEADNAQVDEESAAFNVAECLMRELDAEERQKVAAARRREEERQREEEERQREAVRQRERQEEAVKLCTCNRSREVNDMGYHVCRFYGFFKCEQCRNRWASGNIYVELGHKVGQDCRRCKHNTLAYDMRKLDGRNEEPDDPIHLGGEHMAERCGMCQKLRRKYNDPSRRCDEGRRRSEW